MKKWLRRLFCYHDWEAFQLDPLDPFPILLTCKKCGKEHVVHH